MIAARTAVAVSAGAVMATAVTGASDALTTMPRSVMAATALALAWVALHRDPIGNRRLFAHRARGMPPGYGVLIGALFGVFVPLQMPPPSAGVVARPIGVALHADLFDALARLDADPGAVIGRRISVSGRWMAATDGRDASVSRRVMSCCAADVVDVGFDVEPATGRGPANGAWVRVDGVVRMRVRDGEVRYVLEDGRF